jgi:hypothetical protein
MSEELTQEERRFHAYIGDGVYAQFDGYGVWLRTGNHNDHLCDNRVYLEPSVLFNLQLFLDGFKVKENDGKD